MDSTELRKIRFDLGYNQKEFGALLAVTAQTVCNWEVGRHAIADGYARKIRELAAAPDMIGGENKRRIRTIIRIFKGMDAAGRVRLLGIMRAWHDGKKECG